ncbi:TetR/AcrR family transcriptional regulator [Streptomyces tendae]|uniref:TetR/AcrR family transcriptional regulator n=1 Tax=Streptomyces tendae TaxID=1932 RepID=UPI003718BCFD
MTCTDRSSTQPSPPSSTATDHHTPGSTAGPPLATPQPRSSRRSDLKTSLQKHALSYELYAFAARNPEVREVMRSWMRASRESLARHFDPLTARALDALVEGFSIHNSVDPRPTDRAGVAAVVDAIANRRAHADGGSTPAG